MNFRFTEEQEALREMARAFLAEHAGPAAARAVMASELGHDAALWKKLARELGWAGLLVPEAHGGSGQGPVELAALMELQGEALLCAPYFATAALATNAILLAASEAQQRALLPGIAEGTTRASLAFPENFPDSTPASASDVAAAGGSGSGSSADDIAGAGDVSGADDADAAGGVSSSGAAAGTGGVGNAEVSDGADGDDVAAGGVRFFETPDGYELSGRLRFVPDGHCADCLLVAAQDASAAWALFALPAARAANENFTRAPLPTLDATRRLARVQFKNFVVPREVRLTAAGAGAQAAIARTLDLARVALAAEQVGVAARCLEMATAYAKERVQFGRIIGSFQALKHKLADMMVAVETARSAVYYAAAAAQDAAHAALLPRLASMAKAVADDASRACAGEALQIFGGVGFTWEYDVQLYFKRAHASAALLGDAAYHRERVAQELAL